jgi:uncharacterized protein (TIGR02300 family)
LTAAARLAKGSPDFTQAEGFPIVAKPELGTKRLCSKCGAKFYDLNKSPIICPKCATVFEPAAPSRSRPEPVAPVIRPAPVKVEPVVAEPNVELVSLEEADAEAQGKKPAAGAPGEEVAEEDIEIDETLDDGEEDTFIEPEEEGDEDVTGIIGDVNSEEEP